MPAPFSSPFVTIGGRRTCPCSSMVCCRHPTLRQFFPLLSPAPTFPSSLFVPPAGDFLPIAAESLPRRVSRSPATLRHGNRDTFSKPPRCIRHRRIQRGGFQRTPAETHGFCTSFAACFARWRKTGYTFITLRSVFDGICIGNQKAYSSGVPDKTSKAVLLGRGDTAP